MHTLGINIQVVLLLSPAVLRFSSVPQRQHEIHTRSSCDIQLPGSQYSPVHWKTDGVQGKRGVTLDGHLFSFTPPGCIFLKFVYIFKKKEEKSTLRSPTPHPPFIFCAKRHPSKLMGCSHQHKYAALSVPLALESSASSQWDVKSDRQAWGTQFPMSLASSSKSWGWGVGVLGSKTLPVSRRRENSKGQRSREEWSVQ